MPDRPAFGGAVIARHQGQVVFVRGAVPGETVQARVVRRRKDYLEAEVERVLEPSPDRRDPPCPVFGECGGCQLQFVSHRRQVELKTRVLDDALSRIARLDVSIAGALHGPEFGHRIRARLAVSRDGRVGFRRARSHDVIPLRHCPLLVDGLNGVLSGLAEVDCRGLREVTVTAGEPITAAARGPIDAELARALADCGVRVGAPPRGSTDAPTRSELDLRGMRYAVSPGSFVQSNWALNGEAVDRILELTADESPRRVLDLYCGAGNLALPLARRGAAVEGVDECASAIDDARHNARLNGLERCSFHAASATAALMRIEAAGGSSGPAAAAPPDLVLVDPPRGGLDPPVVDALKRLGAPRLVYLSCDPSTMARDLRRLDEAYVIERAELVDFFPNTYHVESLLLLRAR